MLSRPETPSRQEVPPDKKCLPTRSALPTSIMGRMFSLSGKTIAVIGAGSGIGQAVAIGAAQQGGHGICLDLNADGAAATAATITKARGSADSGAVDITNVTSVRDALANSLHGRSG